jgi:integrase
MRRTRLKIGRKTTKVLRPDGSWDRYYCVTIPKLGGGRRRRFFAHTPEGKREAETFLQIAKVQQENDSAAAFSVPEELRTEALKCQRLLQPANATLTDAVQFYLKHAKPVGGTKTLANAITELLASKRKAGRRESYVSILGWVLKAFARDYVDRHVNEITRHDVESWLDQHGNLATRKNRIRDLAIFFEFCRRRGYCASNPLENIERPIVTYGLPEIFTVEEAAALLTAGEAHPELEFVPAIAIGLFAGLRTAEIKKLDWSNIHFENREIDVGAGIAKRRQQRNVEMGDSLIGWLTPHAKSKGPVYPVRAARRKLEQLRELAGITKWPDNGLRHSFGSYHLACFQNPLVTAFQMGHSTTDMLFNNYRNYRISKKDAEAYWKLAPASRGEKIVAFAAATA